MTERPTNMEDYLKLGPIFGTEEGYQAGLAFQPRPNDVIISPPAKCGTTWLQQIAHGLRTRGSMDFEEITEATPWIELAHDYGWDLEAEQEAKPRLFKSHLTWEDIPKGAQYIWSIRHPYDAAVSHYRFINGWWFEDGSISMDDFISKRILRDPENRGYWYHIMSWWAQRDNENILYLCYEDMQADLNTTIESVAQFIGIELDEELRDIVLRQSSREFMLEHISHFDEHLIQEYFAARGGVPPSSKNAKVTAGAPDEKRFQLSDELKVEFDAVWEKTIYQRFGLEDYDALREAIAELARSRKFS